jgi:hypothetical protein
MALNNSFFKSAPMTATRQATDPGQLVPMLEQAGDNPDATQHFHYDAAAGTGTCPHGVQLDHEGRTVDAGQPIERHRCRCAGCPARANCTRDPPRGGGSKCDRIRRWCKRCASACAAPKAKPAMRNGPG